MADGAEDRREEAVRIDIDDIGALFVELGGIVQRLEKGLNMSPAEAVRVLGFFEIAEQAAREGGRQMRRLLKQAGVNIQVVAGGAVRAEGFFNPRGESPRLDEGLN
jgi:hypothetical protein